jgi:hypothetical protein
MVRGRHMNHIQALNEALNDHWPDERGMCRCLRCAALRDLKRELESFSTDPGAVITVKDERLKCH